MKMNFPVYEYLVLYLYFSSQFSDFASGSAGPV